MGGAEKSTQILAEALAAIGYSVYLLTTSDKNFRDTLNGVNIFYRNFIRDTKPILSIQKLNKINFYFKY